MAVCSGPNRDASCWGRSLAALARDEVTVGPDTPPTLRDCPSPLRGWRCAVDDASTSVFLAPGLAQVPVSVPDPNLDPSKPGLPRVRGYEIDSLIGTGGMGVVYRAHHRDMRRTVAIKTLRNGPLSDSESRERFQAEAEAVARLQHPNIIQVFEIGTVEPLPGEIHPCPFLALEYIDGGSLTRYIDTPQSPSFAARMVEKLARAAHAAHALGVIHRDLKPANVLLSRDGEPKIADFGVAKQMGTEGESPSRFLTQAGIAVGTPEYMAPEQVAGEKPTPAIDIYALGVILYQLLTARLPIQGTSPTDTMSLVRNQEPVSPRRLQPGVPRDLETICLKCLAKSPGRRYETAEALAEDLARWADGRTIQARPVGAMERATRWARRNPTVASLSVAVVLVALAGAAGVVWKWQEARALAVAESVAAGEARSLATAERWERYRANLVIASNAMQLHNTVTARGALEAAPEEHRGWEWRFYSQQLDAAQDTLGTPGEPVRWASISPGAETVTTIGVRGTARFWDVARKREIGHISHLRETARATLSSHRDSLTYSPDPPEDNTLILRDLTAARPQVILRGHDIKITSAQFNHVGTRLATGGQDGVARVWDAKTGKPLLAFQAHKAPAGKMVFSNDDRQLVTTGTSDHTLRIWDVQTGQLLTTLDGHDRNVDAAIFNPSGDRLLAASAYPGNKLWLWAPATRERIAELTGHTNYVVSYLFSPDGAQIATASMDQTVRLWDGRTGRLITILRGHTGWVDDVAYSPDGARIVTASQDRTVRLWDAATGNPLAVLPGHNGEVFRVAYSANGNTIVSASRDGTIKLWDARRAEANHALLGHTKFVYGVAFHPDGERIASASWDGTARIWNATTGRELAVLNCGEKTIVSSVAFHP